MRSLKETSDRLNRELKVSYGIDMNQYMEEMDEINNQTACFGLDLKNQPHRLKFQPFFIN